MPVYDWSVPAVSALLAGDIDVQNRIAADRGEHNRRYTPAGPTSAAAGGTPISP